MVMFMNECFDVMALTQEVSDLIHDMDISWKQVTTILVEWNKSNLLEQQANFINCCGLELEQLLFCVDEAGFDLHLGQPYGYSTSGALLFLSLNV